MKSINVLVQPNNDLVKANIQDFITGSNEVDVKKMLQFFFSEETVKQIEEYIFNTNSQVVENGRGH